MLLPAATGRPAQLPGNARRQSRPPGTRRARAPGSWRPGRRWRPAQRSERTPPGARLRRQRARGGRQRGAGLAGHPCRRRRWQRLRSWLGVAPARVRTDRRPGRRRTKHEGHEGHEEEGGRGGDVAEVGPGAVGVEPLHGQVEAVAGQQRAAAREEDLRVGRCAGAVLGGGQAVDARGLGSRCAGGTGRSMLAVRAPSRRAQGGAAPPAAHLHVALGPARALPEHVARLLRRLALRQVLGQVPARARSKGMQPAIKGRQLARASPAAAAAAPACPAAPGPPAATARTCH
jgi:hypothetical protein